MTELPVLGKESLNEGAILGIDLGTTNTLVAVFDAGGARILANEAGEQMLPSVVSFPLNGNPVVGKEAIERASLDPTRTVHSAKRLLAKSCEELSASGATFPFPLVNAIGKSLALVDLGERQVNPAEILGHILVTIRKRAATALKMDFDKVKRAVITVPAYFDDAQRQATRDAATFAGLEIVRMVSEPTAAALAYGLDKHDKQCVAVYDLGGGTFDVSILKLEKGVFRVLATAGDTQLGGDDFDRTLMQITAKAIQEKTGHDVLATPAGRSALRLAAERCKIQLSNAEEGEMVYQDLEAEIAWRQFVDWKTFQRAITPLVQKTLDACDRALRDAGVETKDLDEVILVGGSTRIPFVKAAVSQHFLTHAKDDIDPDKVVALGAALQAGVLGGRVGNLLLLDVTPLSLGMETMGGSVSKIISRNTAIPAQAKETFTTYVEGQTAIEFHIVQGEREMAADNRSLGKFILRGIPPMPAGLPQATVQFTLDADGVLQVKAKEQRSGVKADIRIEPKHGLTDEEVETMLADAWAHAKEDLIERRLTDLKVQLASVKKSVEKNLALTIQLPKAQKLRLQDAIEEANTASQVTNPDLVKGILDELEDAAFPLAELLMNGIAMEAVKDHHIKEFSGE